MRQHYFPTEAQTIDPDEFVAEMSRHWTERLGNVSSEPLRSTWRQLGEAFGQNILSQSSLKDTGEWTVLCPPTGSGKSQGAVIYCAMLSRFQQEDHPGVLIVTRLIDDCNRMAEEINGYGSMQTAVAYHSEQKEVKMSDLKTFPVVVITHRAYEQALDFMGAGAGIADTWSLFHDYLENDRRKLVIVDEALDVVEHNRVSLDGLRATYGQVPQSLHKQFPKEVESIMLVISILERFNSSQQKQVEQILSHDPLPMLDGCLPDLTEFRKAFRERFSDAYVLRLKDQRALEAVRTRHDNRLRSLHALFRTWQYYARIEGRDTLNTARLLVPDNMNGVVVMDATASRNVVYEVFSKAKVMQPPKGTRRYDNVTLHVSRGHNVGKRRMESRPKPLCKELMGELESILPPQKKCLIVTHKGLSAFMDTFSPKFEKAVTHWGRTTGSNDWKDFDTCVIFGIPYRPPVWPINTFFACQGPQDDRWLQSDGYREYKEHKDIKSALSTSQLVVDIVQAMDRIRSRKVIDSEGNCPPADVYILLPNEQADTIVEGMRTEMPGIKVKPWQYKGQRRKTKRSNYEVGLLKLLEGLDHGDLVHVSYLRDQLGASQRTMADLTKKAQDIQSDLYPSMVDLGVRYETIRGGSTQRATFIRS